MEKQERLCNDNLTRNEPTVEPTIKDTSILQVGTETKSVNHLTTPDLHSGTFYPIRRTPRGLFLVVSKAQHDSDQFYRL